MSRNQPPASAFAVVSPSGSLDASALASSSRADPSKTSSHRAYTTVTPGVPGTAMRSSRYSHPPVSGPMFDFARQKIRRSVSASRTLAVAVTTRGSAPNATDPVTRSMGSRPAVLLVKCEIPRTAASSSLANPASGRRALRTSVFLWVSPVTTGSTSTSAHCGISRAATSSAGMSVAGSNCRAPSRSTEPDYEMDPPRIAASSQESRQQRISRIVLVRPHQHVPGRALRAVRPPAARCHHSRQRKRDGALTCARCSSQHMQLAAREPAVPRPPDRLNAQSVAADQNDAAFTICPCRSSAPG